MHVYAGKKGKKLPTYDTQQKNKLFQSILSYENVRYTSSFWEKSKKYAEQSAALVCLLYLGIITEKELKDNGSILKS